MLKQVILIGAIIFLASSFQMNSYEEIQETQDIRDLIDEISFERGFKASKQEIPTVEQQKNKKYSKAEMPDKFSWSNVDGTNYLTLTLNQKLPEYCSSSWAFAATSAMSDRIKIMRKAAWPDINIGVQQLLSCNTKNFGCNGGDDLAAYEWIYENTIPDQSCSIYQARSWLQGLTCNDFMICGNCDHNKKFCDPIPSTMYHSYGLQSYGKVSLEENMMDEIYQNGPISCAMENTIDLELYTGGVLRESYDYKQQNVQNLNHVVSIVGWGEDENQVPYWFVRNSWGESWGEQGFFKIERGNNTFGIESRCNYGIPKNTWAEAEQRSKNFVNEPLKLRKSGVMTKGQVDPEFLNETLENPPSNVKSPLPHEYIKAEDIPKSWDWRNKDGVNYQSYTTNQHIPVYCGSCWAQGSASSIADRLYIKNKAQFPQPAVSVQAIINCEWGGSCKGGNAVLVYKNAHQFGIPVLTCQNYQSRDPSTNYCTDISRCANCFPTKNGAQVCLPVSMYQEYPRVKVSEYSQIYPYRDEQIQAEIMARGPVSCIMYVTDNFVAYEGGIYREKIPQWGTNHIIQLLGWGENELGEKYWIGRNSWGTYWGDYGYFYITMDDSENLNITQGCSWAIPE